MNLIPDVNNHDERTSKQSFDISGYNKTAFTSAKGSWIFHIKLVVAACFKEAAKAVAKVSGNLNWNQSQETN